MYFNVVIMLGIDRNLKNVSTTPIGHESKDLDHEGGIIFHIMIQR